MSRTEGGAADGAADGAEDAATGADTQRDDELPGDEGEGGGEEEDEQGDGEGAGQPSQKKPAASPEEVEVEKAALDRAEDGFKEGGSGDNTYVPRFPVSTLHQLHVEPSCSSA